ncbi:MAG: hypothetical protein ACJA0Q_000693 [Saprospiraceae bacterium]|jgi:hypothetical protein
MLKYKLQGVSQFKKEYLKEGVYLILLNALKVPPHLLLVVSGKVFSISTLGPALDEEVDKYLRLIDKKKLPTLFVKLSLPDIFTKEDLLEKVRSITSSYPRVDVGLVTCLNPIKDFCSDIYAVDKDQINLVFDLLDELQLQNSIEGYFHMNLNREIHNGEIFIEKYSIFEVNEAIHALV